MKSRKSNLGFIAVVIMTVMVIAAAAIEVGPAVLRHALWSMKTDQYKEEALALEVRFQRRDNSTLASNIGVLFFADEPTVWLYERINGPTRHALSRIIEAKAVEWEEFKFWEKRYVPEILPLKPSPDGTSNVLLMLRLIEEEPGVAFLTRPERVALREKRARRAWADFYGGLHSALEEVE